ncbi:3'-5' exonuclease [Calothrix sp. PCC 6303]|uniref:3'-5' exonuclease n=1 Tax=Calothrix sp. PCC 6303 TaxID=1170562 RepID=UPI0002A048DD|nr:3'-5' exonuclease [Calothrix sp. PCC 6303]AFZ03703.1 3'-5' exonuclease [Calothrix sp. PCC 6303]
MSYLNSSREIRELITKFCQYKTLWIDTEVADFKTKKPRLSLIQILSNPEDMTGEDIYIFDVLEQPELVDKFVSAVMCNPEIEKIFHNAKYDLKFLGGKKAENVTCTLEMAKEIPFYLLPVDNYQLKTLAQELCNFTDIDKLQQTSDWAQRPLTDEQIDYAYLDCIYLAQVYQALLDLQDELNPNPEVENITYLSNRYLEFEKQAKIINSECEHLQERLKKAMQAQDILETENLKLKSYERTTLKAGFRDLMNFAETQGVDFDFSVTLTQKIQKDLGNDLEKLEYETETKTIWQIKFQNSETDD